jgi:hypothetical protein
VKQPYIAKDNAIKGVTVKVSSNYRMNKHCWIATLNHFEAILARTQISKENPLELWTTELGFNLND